MSPPPSSTGQPTQSRREFGTATANIFRKTRFTPHLDRTADSTSREDGHPDATMSLYFGETRRHPGFGWDNLKPRDPTLPMRKTSPNVQLQPQPRKPAPPDTGSNDTDDSMHFLGGINGGLWHKERQVQAQNGHTLASFAMESTATPASEPGTTSTTSTSTTGTPSTSHSSFSVKPLSAVKKPSISPIHPLSTSYRSKPSPTAHAGHANLLSAPFSASTAAWLTQQHSRPSPLPGHATDSPPLFGSSLALAPKNRTQAPTPPLVNGTLGDTELRSQVRSQSPGHAPHLHAQLNAQGTSQRETPDSLANPDPVKKTTSPKKGWTVESLAEALEQKTREMKMSHQDLVAFTLKSAKPVERRIKTGKDWFAGLKCDPVPADEPKDDSMLKVKVKHHVRGKRDQRVFHFRVLCIKTDKPSVPRYRFHHKEIARNVLTPNTMLKFVPHIRDLDPSEEREYNVWLKQLERMDASCGFKPMGTREQRVIRTTKKERTAMVALYLPDWLEKLAIDGCTRSTLIRHMVDTGSDIDITPQQKSSLYQLHSNDNDSASASPKAGRTAAMFTEAFDKVFHDDAPPDRAITLRDILMLDKGVDDIVEAKKTAKGGTQEDAVKADDPQTFLETYSIMGCLICFSNSCEHGDYGVNNEKRNFSLDCNGQLEQPLAKSKAAMEKRDRDGTVIEPCYRDCFMTHDPKDPRRQAEPPRPWTSDEEMMLKTLFSVVECSSRVTSKPECMAAEILDRRCWDVRHQLVKLDVFVPEDNSPNGSLPPAKVLPWYDRYKKVLIGDWQDHTKTHDHKLRVLTEPCHHDGPCTLANGCDCVANGLLCERFCRCTVENCSYKFTGCACSGTGKTCQQRQCICVQLNRECDPMLCGSCGVWERTLPKNRENDQLMETGCQNCYLQRGRSKALAPGKSQLDGCGYGLFALEDIAQHEFVIEYTGELIMHDEGVRREARRGEAFDQGSFTSYVFSLLDAEGIWVDAAIYGNHSRYINHAQQAYNLEPKIVYVGGEYRIRFTAIRNIQAGEELFFNYGDSFPNLTKKMIKDKTSEDDARAAEGSPSRKDKVRGRSGGKAGPGNKSGKSGKKGTKGRGREKPGARKEAPIATADDLGELADFSEYPTRSRKRKRGYSFSEEEAEEEYRPSQEESEGGADPTGPLVGPHRRRARRRVRSPSTASTDVYGPEAIGMPNKDGGRRRRTNGWASTVPDPSTPPPRPKRRGRPPRAKSVAGGQSTASPNGEVQSVASPEKGTPVRPPPSRGRQRGRSVFESENSNEQEVANRTRCLPRGNRRRVVVDSDDDSEDDVGSVRPGTADSGLEVDDSYESQPVAPLSIPRSNRPRKRPARYRDGDE